MTDAKLTQLVEFYGRKLDTLNSESEFDRGCYTAYSIARIMTQNILYELLDKQLSDSLDDFDLEFE